MFYYLDKKCKFKDKCFFRHIKKDFEDENRELKKNVVTLTDNITNLEAKIDILEKTLNKKNTEVTNQGNDKKSQEKKIKELKSKLDKNDLGLKETKMEITDLKKQNDSFRKVNANLEVRVQQSIDIIEIKDTKIGKLEKEAESSNIILAAKEREIKNKYLKFLELEKNTQSLNVSLVLKETEIENHQKNLVKLQMKIDNFENKKEETIKEGTAINNQKMLR